MASLAIAAAVVGAAGTAISAISQSNALRAQASARKEAGRQELELAKRKVRSEFGQQVVSVGASGLLGQSFSEVFDAQAFEDTQFLGRIQQRTRTEVQNLRQQAKTTLITGLISATAQGIGGLSAARAQAGQVRAAEGARRARLRLSPGSRLRPGGNIFGPGRQRGVPFGPGPGAF